MKLDLFLNWVDSYLNFEKKQTKGIFWLDSMKYLCSLFDNPQDQIKCIHVAGSKGKGSVCKMISSSIEAAGFKCGLYSSPHITDFRERICRPSGFFEDSVYEKAAELLYNKVSILKLSDLPGERPLTWFELVTVFAFLCYKEAKVDYVVYETGLGGRLDSTNVVNPLVSVITPIELEHTEFLGKTIPLIAGEKAGIIKNNVPCVVSKQKYPEALDVFYNKCNETESNLFDVDSLTKVKSISYENGRMKTVLEIDGESYNLNLKMLGMVQAYNACTSFVALKVALPFLRDEDIIKGLEEAFLEGRFEVSNNGDLPLILDGAHTVNSIDFTLKTFKDLYGDKPCDLLFACAQDKDYKDIVPMFKDRFCNVTVTKPGLVRASDIKGVCKVMEDNLIPYKAYEDPKEGSGYALQRAREEGHVLLVTGSFYLLQVVKG